LIRLSDVDLKIDNGLFISTLLNLIPLSIVLLIDTSIYIFKLLNKFEKHKSRFIHNLSGMLKYTTFACVVYWLSNAFYHFYLMPSLNVTLYFPQRMNHNDVSAFAHSYVGIWIFQFFLSKAIISKGKSFFKQLGIYGYKIIISFISNKKFVEIDRSDFSIGKKNFFFFEIK